MCFALCCVGMANTQDTYGMGCSTPDKELVH